MPENLYVHSLGLKDYRKIVIPFLKLYKGLTGSEAGGTLKIGGHALNYVNETILAFLFFKKRL